MEEIKVCMKCKQELPATTKYFYRVGGRTPIGNRHNSLRSVCKECQIKEAVINQRRRKYLMEDGTYKSILERQNGVCRICQEPCSTNSGLSVDHDHKTNRIRGLLCHGCNTGIGKFKDSVYILLRAAMYVLTNRIKGWFK